MPGLGLGLEISKFNKPLKNYILDELGNVNNCVLGVSLYKLTNRYKSYCLRVRRSSDDDELDIGFLNGFIDINLLESFCSGTNGFTSIWYNQSQSIGVQNALQTTNGSQPQIVSSGSLLTNGLKFDGTDDYFDITDYAAIQILDPELSIYSNVYQSPLTTGYVYCKNYDSAENSTHRRYTYSGDNFALGAYTFSKSLNSGTNKSLAIWRDKEIGGRIIINNAGEDSKTADTTLTNYQFVTIGARSNDASGTRSTFISGNIKTLLLFNSNEYNNYTQLANNC